MGEAFSYSSILMKACQIILSAKPVNEPFINRKISEGYNKPS
jgi:hypothetical protein